jgi:hypothetical protein
MKNYIPFEKRSKKRKKEENKIFRRSWGVLNPVTRCPPNPKAYDRNKEKAKPDDV